MTNVPEKPPYGSVEDFERMMRGKTNGEVFPYTIGVIESIVTSLHRSDAEKVERVCNALIACGRIAGLDIEQFGKADRLRTDASGLAYSRADDGEPEVAPGRVEPHTGAVTDGGLVDETAEDSAAIVDQNLRAMGSVGLDRRSCVDPGDQEHDHAMCEDSVADPDIEYARKVAAAGDAWVRGGPASIDPDSSMEAHYDAECDEMPERQVDETPPVHLGVMGARTMCGPAIIKLPSGHSWTEDHASVTCKACIGLSF